jgi:hypothetical protein
MARELVACEFARQRFISARRTTFNQSFLGNGMLTGIVPGTCGPGHMQRCNVTQDAGTSQSRALSHINLSENMLRE